MMPLGRLGRPSRIHLLAASAPFDNWCDGIVVNALATGTLLVGNTAKWQWP